MSSTSWVHRFTYSKYQMHGTNQVPIKEIKTQHDSMVLSCYIETLAQHESCTQVHDATQFKFLFSLYP